MKFSSSHKVTSSIAWLRFIPGPCLFTILTCLAIAAEPQAPPKIWLSHYKLGTLATAEDGDWPVTRGGVDTAFFVINTLWPLQKPMRLSIPPAAAAAAAANLHKNNIKIGIECGYFDHPVEMTDWKNPASDVVPIRSDPQLTRGIGERTAKVEIAKLRSIWQAGHPPDYLILDDPMRRLTIPGQDNLGQILKGMPDYPSAAKEVTSYMSTMKRQFPKVKFVIIVNFPNWGWKGGPAYSVAAGRNGPMNWGDAHVALEALFSAVKSSDLPIHAIQADFPWRYFAEQPPDAFAATVDWPDRLLQLEQFARSKGVRFHLTTNSETGYVSAQAFAEDSLKYLDAFLAAGGKPDHFVVQSWYPYPKELLPESEPHTSSWLAARFIQRLREIQAGSPVAMVPPKPRVFDRSEPEALLHLIKRLDPKLWSKLSPRILESWLNLPEDPPASLAGKQLLVLRNAAASAIEDKPKATIVLRDDSASPAMGLPPLMLKKSRSNVWIVELVCGTTQPELITAWMENTKEEPMAPIWLSPGTSRLLAVDIDASMIKDKSVEICIGTPNGSYRKVSIPVILKR